MPSTPVSADKMNAPSCLEELLSLAFNCSLMRRYSLVSLTTTADSLSAAKQRHTRMHLKHPKVCTSLSKDMQQMRGGHQANLANIKADSSKVEHVSSMPDHAVRFHSQGPRRPFCTQARGCENQEGQCSCCAEPTGSHIPCWTTCSMHRDQVLSLPRSI